MKNLLSAIPLATMVLSFFCQTASGFEFSREERLQHADESIQRVRQNINNPDIVEYELLSMAQTIGDDPRVLPLCKEVAEKSTDPRSIGIALSAAEEIFGHDAASPEKIVEVYRIGVRRGDLHDRITAARFISSMGGQYRQKGHALFLQLLHEKVDPKTVFDAMVESFGTDEDVIDHFGHIVAISTDATIVNEALNSLRTIVNRDVKNKNSGKAADSIASIYRTAMGNKEIAVGLNAAYYLSEMGPLYAAEARRFYEDRLRKPFGMGPEAQTAKWASIQILRPMLEANKPADYPLLKDAAKTNDLLSYFNEKFVETEGAATFNHRLFERWKALIQGDNATP